jgi:AAA+ superfamily predicted ATPase
MKLPTQLFSASLCLPDNAMAFELSKQIRAAANDKSVLETEDYYFDPIGFANSGGCELIVRDDANGHWEASWDDGNIELQPRNAIMDVVWRGNRYTLAVVKHDECGRGWYIVSESTALCEQFFAAVCKWNTTGNNAVTVFDEGYFERDEELREEIKSRKLEDMVLQPSIRQQLNHDVLEFFSQKEWYTEQGLPWKRGIILHGPPGNGKTQTIRALINEANVATIYVRSLWSYRMPPEVSIKRIYERAREIAPCIVVMEDVDSLISAGIRSYFLNELDGMRTLNGVMTIVTTNHLEALDVAIRNRPSRFDVKIEFANPDAEMRAAYMGEPLFLMKLKSEFATEVVQRTEGLSFAGLQEFVRSSVTSHRRVMDLEKAIRGVLDEMVGSSETQDGKPKKKNKKKKSS